jgi:hypothetical protein
MSESNVLDVSLVDPSNVSIDLTGQEALIDLIKIAIVNDDIKNKISIKLRPDIINLINNIITLSPGSLNDIDKSVKDVIKDGKINAKDISGLIVIIQVLYRLIYSIKTDKFDSKKSAEATSVTLKFIVHLLVLERKIVIPEENQKEILSDIDILIDNCIELLTLQKLVKTKSCFKKLFKF